MLPGCLWQRRAEGTAPAHAMQPFAIERTEVMLPGCHELVHISVKQKGSSKGRPESLLHESFMASSCVQGGFNMCATCYG